MGVFQRNTHSLWSIGSYMTFPGLHNTLSTTTWTPESFKCSYTSFDDAVALIVKHGVGTLFVQLDLEDPFKHILVRAQDCPALGSFWDLQLPDGTVAHLYYIVSFLPFALHSFPALFNEYADALQYDMHVIQVGDLLHYLDDYFTVDPPDSPVCVININTMVATYKEPGFSVNPKKVTQPSTMTNFLRIDINSVHHQAHLESRMTQGHHSGTQGHFPGKVSHQA